MTPDGRAPVSVKPIGVSPLAVTEKVPGAVLGERDRGARGEHRCRGGHRQGEGLGGGVGVGVGGGDGDRVAAGGAEGRRARQGAVGGQGDVGGQGAGLGEADRGVAGGGDRKVPALFSAKLVDAAEVNTGAEAVTVRVKAWVVVLALASVAVMVIG